ncbi:MAG TPA: ATP-binding protein [Solirubrobacteraceae bacterium]|nr:ATP-binding protein [Solirubrobacteraceae bacterium]
MSPRTVVGVAASALALVLALFAIALVRTNAADRAQVEARFQDRARVSAALTEAVFSTTAGQSSQQNARRLGGRVTTEALDAVVRQGNLRYLVILDDRGQLLQASSGTPDASLRRLAARPPEVAEVMAGRPFHLSDVLDAGALHFVSSFEAEFGRRRYVVSAFSAELISGFLAGYLGELPRAWRASPYVIDSAGRVVGSPVRGQEPGRAVREPGLTRALEGGGPLGTFDSAGRDRAYAVEPVENSSWRVALSMPEATLYRGTGALLEWLILAALAAAGLTALVTLGRAVRAAAEVRAANEELARFNIELQRSNAELEQFASVASHDLQEPLRKVQTFGDQLERRFGEHLPEDAQDYLRRMRRAAARMSTLIEDLLRFSRVTTHARPHEPVDLERVAWEVTSDLEAALNECDGRVEIGPLPTVQADALQMRQLLQNLIANGIKFRRPGVAPVVRVEPVPAPEGSLAFAVEDNGIGFESQYGERIFRVFERLHPRDVYEGTGIGLAMCRKIAERHGGTIDAEGRPDRGARFVVTLPVAPPAAASAPTDEPEPAHA